VQEHLQLGHQPVPAQGIRPLRQKRVNVMANGPAQRCGGQRRGIRTTQVPAAGLRGVQGERVGTQMLSKRGGKRGRFLCRELQCGGVVQHQAVVTRFHMHRRGTQPVAVLHDKSISAREQRGDGRMSRACHVEQLTGQRVIVDGRATPVFRACQQTFEMRCGQGIPHRCRLPRRNQVRDVQRALHGAASVALASQRGTVN